MYIQYIYLSIDVDLQIPIRMTWTQTGNCWSSWQNTFTAAHKAHVGFWHWPRHRWFTNAYVTHVNHGDAKSPNLALWVTLETLEILSRLFDKFIAHLHLQPLKWSAEDFTVITVSCRGRWLFLRSEIKLNQMAGSRPREPKHEGYCWSRFLSGGRATELGWTLSCSISDVHVLPTATVCRPDRKQH